MALCPLRMMGLLPRTAPAGPLRRSEILGIGAAERDVLL